MCGRFTLTMEELQIRETFSIGPGNLDWIPRYNISPKQSVLAVLLEGNTRHLRRFYWGVVPFWMQTRKFKNPLFNARSETLWQLDTWHRLVPRRRCLIPADGWYAWDRSHQPYRIHLRFCQLFGFAGLWDTWEATDGSRQVSGCTIITCAASPSIAHISPRMPVILRPNDLAVWLDATEPEPLRSFLHPVPDEALSTYSVSKSVNDLRHEGASCIIPSPIAAT